MYFIGHTLNIMGFYSTKNAYFTLSCLLNTLAITNPIKKKIKFIPEDSYKSKNISVFCLNTFIFFTPIPNYNVPYICTLYTPKKMLIAIKYGAFLCIGADVNFWYFC